MQKDFCNSSGWKAAARSARWRSRNCPQGGHFLLYRDIEVPLFSPASIWLNVGVLDHLPSVNDFGLHVVSQLLRGAGKSLEAYVLEFCLDIRVVDDLAQRSVELGYDFRWCARRRNETGPGIQVEAFDSGLIHCRQVREQRTALYA